MLERFRFVPMRGSTTMVSYATDGGSVGHTSIPDVFLLQIHSIRRWRIGRIANLPATAEQRAPEDPHQLRAGHDWLLEPGDMLYPPGWAHDGIAEGECMTCSIGFRSAGAI